ncbi:MAG: RNA-binding protein [Saprospiraceae bacterium]|nr:RNA-binding protein [Saprospiraceae bacterium]
MTNIVIFARYSNFIGIHFVLYTIAMYDQKSAFCYLVFFYLSSLLLSTGCQTGQSHLFTDVTGKCGIDFRNDLVSSPDLRIMTYPYFYNGAGVGAGDFNNDGLVDLYFASNQKEDKIYINQGNLQFLDVSSGSGIANHGEWHTGVNVVDVNADGWLDIYVCTVSGIGGLQGHNRLYINNGDLTFSEAAETYGLDFSGLSTQAAFFDYDQDGDLDCYLLNHAAHDAFSSYTLRAKNVQNELLGDRFYINQNGAFQNKTAEIGIIQAYNGFGLGISVSDFNNDGWVDIYVCNDFLEDDFLYINQHGLGFKESLHDMFAHTSKFSMGADAADVNNDGYTDLLTLDMRPPDEWVLKTSTGEDPPQVYEFKINQGYLHQYAQNCLQLNMGGSKFSDIAPLAGVEATDWSWSALFADFDLDGQKDLFVSNGIPNRPNNYDFVNYIYSQVSANTTTQDFHAIWDKATPLMPDGAARNHIYQGQSDFRFVDKSLDWGFSTKDYSNGSLYADLDNDGDLDLVSNRLNNTAGIWRNNAAGRDYLRIKLTDAGSNSQTLGSKVYIWQGGQYQYQELMNVRGFLSSVDHTLIFGLTPSPIDSVIVIWPGGHKQIITTTVRNQTLTISPEKNLTKPSLQPKEPGFFVKNHSISFEHKQDQQSDFLQNPLQIFDLSKAGPALAAGDVNADGLDDLFVGAASSYAGAIWIQQSDGHFLEMRQPVFENDAMSEDTDAAFLDFDLDGDLDLYVASGGNQVREYLTDRLYINDGSGRFTSGQRALPILPINTACVRPADFDKDGDLDIFVGGRNIKNRYGETPQSYLLENQDGKFVDVTPTKCPELLTAGMVTDATWVDFDDDKVLDLVIVGEWMAPMFIENRGVTFSPRVRDSRMIGLWNTIEHGDLDSDGDQDLLLGNLGLNSTIFGSDARELKLYLIKRDQSLIPVLSYRIDDEFYPVHSKDELERAFPELGKKFNHYGDFAGKSVEEVFGNMLVDANVLQANQFASLYLENVNGAFKEHSLPAAAQVSCINSSILSDINGDGHLDMLLAGNNYNVVYTHTRNDASYGLTLLGDGEGNFDVILPQTSGFWAGGPVSKLTLLRGPGRLQVAIARNDAALSVYQLQPALLPLL